MVGSVSFGNTAVQQTNISDLINKPQTYVKKDEPQAAAPIESGAKKKGSVPKAILKTLVGAAAIAGALALVSKKGVLKINPDGNKIVNTIKTGVNTAGEFVSNKFDVVKDFILSHVNARTIQEAGEAALDASV